VIANQTKTTVLAVVEIFSLVATVGLRSNHSVYDVDLVEDVIRCMNAQAA
jgi:hypothetical protein